VPCVRVRFQEMNDFWYSKDVVPGGLDLCVARGGTRKHREHGTDSQKRTKSRATLFVCFAESEQSILRAAISLPFYLDFGLCSITCNYLIERGDGSSMIIIA
jgi:hypothetical protein